MSLKQRAHGSELHGYPISRRPIKFDPRQEPGAGKPHAGICAGGRGAILVPTATLTRILECSVVSNTNLSAIVSSQERCRNSRSEEGCPGLRIYFRKDCRELALPTEAVEDPAPGNSP